jgi:hypothetical protein
MSNKKTTPKKTTKKEKQITIPIGEFKYILFQLEEGFDLLMDRDIDLIKTYLDENVGMALWAIEPMQKLHEAKEMLADVLDRINE